MRVCVCVREFVCVYVSVYVCACVCVSACVCVCACESVCVRAAWLCQAFVGQLVSHLVEDVVRFYSRGLHVLVLIVRAVLLTY